jgi:hypothetical protein
MAAFTTDHLQVQVDGGVEQVFRRRSPRALLDLLGVAPAADA